ncbi:uncharacterized protein [Aegilops tauschii subsp. strangulata]|uniref:uncharacterized protein n=1 Tax=Aegilops tauschii subsp. strangulata TaxID=200361 RepID=UPI003CC89823
MRKTSPFEWNDQADEAFRDLKRMLTTTHVLASPTDKEPMFLYIGATSRSVSTNYPHHQKMCYDVYFTAKKLKQYFQEHVVTMASAAPIGEIMGYWDASGRELGIVRILCYGDSDLVVQQCSGEWDARDANMASYRFLVQQLSGTFDGCEFLHVPRAENEAAGTLAKIGSSRQAIPPGVSLEHLRKPSVKLSPDSESILVPDDPVEPLPKPDPGAAISNLSLGTADPGPWTADPDPGAALLNPAAAILDTGAAVPEPVLVAVFAVVTAPSWAKPISAFLENGALRTDEIKARQVQHRASAYSVINDELVKRNVTGVFQHCVEQDKGIEILLDIHQGECGTTPPPALQTIPFTWPFAVWGLDMVGPFKTTWGGMTHLLVAADKFTKWIEARPIKKLDGPTTVRFVKDIAVRYGVPHNIVTNNGTNFAKGALAQYCSVSDIHLDLASMTHPQSNGEVERANGLILSGIKPQLVEPLVHSPVSWLDELPAVLWSLSTMPNQLNVFSRFFLVYGAEAVIPTDVEFDSSRVAMAASASDGSRVGLPSRRLLFSGLWVRRGAGVSQLGILIRVGARLLRAAFRVVQQKIEVILRHHPLSSSRSTWNSSCSVNEVM